MTNKEKFRNEIENIVFSGKNFGFRDGIVKVCKGDCEGCYFHETEGPCSYIRIAWLNAEYKEPSEAEPEGYEKYRGIVRDSLSERDLLEGIAEECAELAKACMKLIRACGKSGIVCNANWTPVSEVEARENIFEEITDILCYFDVLGIPVKPASESDKWERWAYRVTHRKDMEE